MRIWFSHPSHRALLQVSKLIIENRSNELESFFLWYAAMRLQALDKKSSSMRQKLANYLWSIWSMHIQSPLVHLVPLGMMTLYNLIKLHISIHPVSLELQKSRNEIAESERGRCGRNIILVCILSIFFMLGFVQCRYNFAGSVKEWERERCSTCLFLRLRLTQPMFYYPRFIASFHNEHQIINARNLFNISHRVPALSTIQKSLLSSRF